jgi:hypothetical protein
LNQGVPEHRETPKKIGEIHDMWRCGPVAFPALTERQEERLGSLYKEKSKLIPNINHFF